MKSTLLLALALAAVDAAPATSKADAAFSWASVLEGRPIVGNENVKQDVHEFLGLSPDVKFRNFKALDVADSLERRAGAEITTNNMCGAFQEKANGTAAGYSTAAAMFKVPKLARRGTSSDTQIISTFVGIDGIRCPGMEIGVISTISSTGSQRNLAYFRYGDDAPYRVDSVNPNNGDLMAAATTFDADGTVYVMIMNRETGDKYGDYLTLGPKPCMASVSWTVEDYVAAEGATPLPKEHYPSWEPVKFGYMDANKTDGSSFHLDGATFTSMVGKANGTLAGKLICRGAPNANITNQMLISAL